MRIRVEVDELVGNNEIVIRCKEINEEVLAFQKALEELVSQQIEITFYKQKTTYFIPLDEILFFETEGNTVCAHSNKEMYHVKFKLYELESLLPSQFLRISKSTILNVNHIQSITRHLTASSIVEFQKSHKQVYVSRHYYKILQTKLNERRR